MVPVLAALALGCSTERSDEEGSASSKDRPNVLLISLDTTRADALASYGNKEAMSPNIDRLAEEGTRFSRAFSVTPLTIPAHSSLFTGLYPPRHGVRDNGDFYLGDEAYTLAERLSDHGYSTMASVGAEVTTHRWGFGQGFQAYFDDMGTSAEESGSRWRVERPANLVIDDALEWLAPAMTRESPWFAWVHVFDVHHPYEPPPPYDQLFSEQPYLGELAWVDEQIGRLLTALEHGGALANTWVFVVADHGEGMGSHGELLHGVLLYNATVRVPFIVRPPAGRPAPSFEHFPVSLVDVTPTVLALTEIGGGEDLDGMDLSPWLQADNVGPLPPRDRAVYVESLYAYRHYGWAAQRAVVTAETKLIDSTTPELYARDDYAEVDNRAGEDESLVESLQVRAAQISERLAKQGVAEGAQLDAEQLAQLEALGYVTAAANVATDQDGFGLGLPDPVSRLPVLREVERARQAVQAGELESALQRLDDVLRDDPGLVQPQLMRAHALWRMERPQEALLAFTALAAQTKTAGVEVSLGSLKRELGDVDAAIAHYELALSMEPYLESAWRPYLRTLYATGRQAELISALQRVRERRPELGTAKVLAAMLALQRGAANGEMALRQALREHPEEAGARVLLAGQARARGDWKDAARLLREELSLPIARAPVRRALIEALAKDKQYEAQLAEIEIHLESAPSEPLMLHARAQALYNLKRFEDSLEAVERCMETAPRLAACHLLAANVFQQLGKSAEAQEAFQRANALREAQASASPTDQ